MLASESSARTSWLIANCHCASFDQLESERMTSTNRECAAANLAKPSQAYETRCVSLHFVKVLPVATSSIERRKHLVGQARYASNKREVTNLSSDREYKRREPQLHLALHWPKSSEHCW